MHEIVITVVNTTHELPVSVKLTLLYWIHWELQDRLLQLCYLDHSCEDQQSIDLHTEIVVSGFCYM